MWTIFWRLFPDVQLSFYNGALWIFYWNLYICSRTRLSSNWIKFGHIRAGHIACMIIYLRVIPSASEMFVILVNTSSNSCSKNNFILCATLFSKTRTGFESRSALGFTIIRRERKSLHEFINRGWEKGLFQQWNLPPSGVMYSYNRRSDRRPPKRRTED